MAQQVDVKGFGLVEFPDNLPRETMLQALRARFADANAGKATATVAPYEPTLAERAQRGVSDFLTDKGIISNRYGAERIGENVSTALNFLPVVGDALGGDEFGRALKSGSAGDIGFAALGAIPVVGDAVKGLRKPMTDMVDLFDYSQPKAAVDLSAKSIQDEFKKQGVQSFIRENSNAITLDKVIVPKEQRGSGIGTSFMDKLISYSDSKGLPVALTPSSDFGGSKSRLIDFYKRFGFVENKGKNKRYDISESMYREPITER